MATAFANLPADAQRAKVEETARRIVFQNVCYCVSYLVSALAAREWDGSDGIDPDDLSRLGFRDPDADDFREMAREMGVFDCPPGSPRADGRMLSVSLTGSGKWAFSTTDADGDETDNGAGYATEADAWAAGFNSLDIDQPDGTECLEHWLVTDWLAEKLEKHGESVARDVAGLTIWGRCTSGQVIYADAVMQAIAREIEEA